VNVFEVRLKHSTAEVAHQIWYKVSLCASFLRSIDLKCQV
jgi:hypothetical protein